MNEVVEEHRGSLNRSFLESKDLPTIPECVKIDGYYSLSDDDDNDSKNAEGGDEAVDDMVEHLYDRC